MASGTLKADDIIKQIAEMQKLGLVDPHRASVLGKRLSDFLDSEHTSDAFKFASIRSGQTKAMAGNVAQAAMPNPALKFTSTNMQARLNVRMCWNLPGETCPLDYFSAHKAGDEAVVFVIHNGNPLMLRDDLNLFPSDALITQIRLLTDK